MNSLATRPSLVVESVASLKLESFEPAIDLESLESVQLVELVVRVVWMQQFNVHDRRGEYGLTALSHVPELLRDQP
jgi:hypothetical protein